MLVLDVRYVGLDVRDPRSGVPAEILGVRLISRVGRTGKWTQPVPCYEIRYPDGVHDFAPIGAGPGPDRYLLAPPFDARAAHVHEPAPPEGS